MDIIFVLIISLIHSTSVVILVTYLITRTKVYTEIVEKRFTLENRLFLIVTLGLFSIYGTLGGVEILGARANIRDLGPAIAGLVGGPIVGFGAGFIGALHRYLLGGFTCQPCALATIFTGLAAGLIYKLNKDRFIGVAGAALFGITMQLFHAGLVILISRPLADAIALEKEIFLPMLTANTIGLTVFALFITNLKKERETEAERDAYLLTKERMESELRVAHDIQFSMLPKIPSPLSSGTYYDLYATIRSAKEVSGDLYDFFQIDGDHLFFIVGDVSGKGVPAALFMALTKTLLKGMSTPGMEPDELLSKVNSKIIPENDSLMFVTLFCGKLNFKTGELIYTNAGHNPPLIIRQNKEVDWLKLPPGLVLGVESGVGYTSKKVKLAPEEGVIVYTDGVTEAMNRAQELFSEDRLIETVRSFKNLSAKEMVDNILKAVSSFTLDVEQSDDITIMALCFKGPGHEGSGSPSG